MKINRRDKKLDSLIGKKVIIEFDDDDFVIGILGWQGAYDSNNGLKPFSYHVKKANGSHLCFKKSHVISVKEVNDE